jgi:hypothetical protein
MFHQPLPRNRWRERTLRIHDCPRPKPLGDHPACLVHNLCFPDDKAPAFSEQPASGDYGACCDRSEKIHLQLCCHCPSTSAKGEGDRSSDRVIHQTADHAAMGNAKAVESPLRDFKSNLSPAVGPLRF